MSYKSPIEVLRGPMNFEVEKQIVTAIQSIGVQVDKDELERALKYDRDQYSKGYKDGYEDGSGKEVLEKFCDELQSEIQAALSNNYQVLKERKEHRLEGDTLIPLIEGKVAALRGIDDFIDTLLEKYLEGGDDE